MKTTRVILADDHDVVRAGIANALKDMSDLEIVGEVGDGASLFAALARHQPDCLLVDVTMPHFEPISSIQQIRATYPDLVILVVSAYDDDIYVQGLLGAGVNGYHLKDQPLNDLRLAVRRVLAGERWVSSSLVDKLLRAHHSAPNTPALTTRQRDLLRCLQQGLDNQAIAQQMELSVKTVENHLTRLYRRLGVQSRLEAVHYVMQHPDLLTTVDHVLGVPEPIPHTNDQMIVVLVDDNQRYRGQLRRMVSKACPQAVLHEAANTREAVALVRSMPTRLAFVDVVLGDEDGIQCTREIKAIAHQTRVVLISAYPDREFHRLGLAAGAVAFLDKKDLNTVALRQLMNDLVA
ncbi:MAG: response regulator transcription factor [Chloroflexaceae bacterium]|nr:response regulator transcription factor [Chloroflexaceae bacterium]